MIALSGLNTVAENFEIFKKPLIFIRLDK